MTIQTVMPFAVEEVADLGIMLSDGVRLSARIWLPKGLPEGPVPAILEYIPYRKRDGTLPRDELMHPWFAGHGYAAVRVDLRGSGDSLGVMGDEYSAQEMADAQEVIAWLAAQDWCSGAVGMMGKSWGGFNALQAAYQQKGAGPLKAVLAVCATVNRFTDDIHFKDGCLLGENFGWGSVMLSYSSRPPDPALVADWRAEWLRRLEANPWLPPVWASHQAMDAYWAHGSVATDWARMDLPVMIWGGWADNYMNALTALITHAPAPRQAVCGPWVHDYPHTAVPAPRIGFLQMALRWWDRWLKELPNGAEADPIYRAYLLHAPEPDASAAERPGAWVSASAWPLPEASAVTFHLTEAEGSTGRLAREKAAGPLARQIATPQHLGLRAGEFFPCGLNAEMAADQADDDALSLCFEGPVLDAPLRLLGGAELRLELSSDCDMGFVVARLCDVAPDGRASRISHGMLNLCHRDGFEHPSRLPLGQTLTVSLRLDDMGWQLAPGHRLRLALSNSYWPFVWPSAQKACLTVSGGTLHLSVVETALTEWLPPPPVHAQPWAHKLHRAGQSRRIAQEDLTTGVRSLIIEEDTGLVENLDHGLVTGERMTERWQIQPDDPLSAQVRCDWEQHLSRGDWNVRTHAQTQMTATASHLRMCAHLTAYEGEALIFERHWEQEVPRSFV